MQLSLQGQLRDEDLTALEVPVLFIKGTKDPFSTEDPWRETLSRMQSPQVEVEVVVKGDHSLSAKTGVGKQRNIPLANPHWLRMTACLANPKLNLFCLSADGSSSAGCELGERYKQQCC